MILTPGLSERKVKMIDLILTSNTDQEKSDMTSPLKCSIELNIM